MKLTDFMRTQMTAFELDTKLDQVTTSQYKLLQQYKRTEDQIYIKNVGEYIRKILIDTVWVFDVLLEDSELNEAISVKLEQKTALVSTKSS